MINLPLNRIWLIVTLILLLTLTACGQDGNNRGESNNNRPADVPANNGERGNSANAPGHNKTPGVPPGQANRPDKPERGNDENEGVTAVAPSAPLTDNPLKERFATLQPDDDGMVSITITDDEFNQAIQLALSQSSQPSPIDNPQVTFTSEHIILTGNVTDPVTGQLTVTFRPYITNGLLQFEVVSATLGDVRVPAPLLASAQNTLNTTLSEAMSNMPGTITLQEIIMGEGTMTIIGNATP